MCNTLFAFELIGFDSLYKKYTKQVKCLGQTGFGLTIEQLKMSTYSSMLGKCMLLCIYVQPVEYHTAQIRTDFPWFHDLHGWWKNNPVCNRTFNMAHPGQSFFAQVAVLFGLPEGTHTPPDDGQAPYLPLLETSSDTATLLLAPSTMSLIAATVHLHP